MSVSLLDGATATGAGPAFIVRDVVTHGMQVNPTGLTSLSVNLEGSLSSREEIDAGTAVWTTLANTTATTASLTHAVDKPVKYVRANVATIAGGGSVDVRWVGYEG